MERQSRFFSLEFCQYASHMSYLRQEMDMYLRSIWLRQTAGKAPAPNVRLPGAGARTNYTISRQCATSSNQRARTFCVQAAGAAFPHPAACDMAPAPCEGELRPIMAGATVEFCLSLNGDVQERRELRCRTESLVLSYSTQVLLLLLNNAFISDPAAASAKPSKRPSSARSLAARIIPPHATRAKPPPTLTRLTPNLAISEIVMSLADPTSKLTGFG